MMTQGASTFSRLAERPGWRRKAMPGDFPDVVWKWEIPEIPPEPERGFAMWEFRGEPFASEEELRLKLAVMGLELAGENENLRGTYCRAYRVVPGPGVSGEGESPSRNSLGENAV